MKVCVNKESLMASANQYLNNKHTDFKMDLKKFWKFPHKGK